MKNLLEHHGITYDRPGFRLTCQMETRVLDLFGHWKIYISAVVPNSLKPDEMVTIHMAEMIHSDREEDHVFIVNVVSDLVRRFVQHESDEWFKVRGEHHRKPHR